MGTTGYRYAGELTYQPNEVILEVGGGESTAYLAKIGPPVVTVNVNLATHQRIGAISNVESLYGRAEDELCHWNRPIGFAWLDGHDWPYSVNPAGYYAEQRAEYQARGQRYTQSGSRQSHLAIARLIGRHARVIAFDDTWRTHAYRSTGDRCVETVPPATPPAPALAMDQPTGELTCNLPANHAHHDSPGRGWNGKGGTAIPYLLAHGFRVVEDGLCLVVLKRVEDDE